MKLLETRVIAYDIMALFIVPDFIDEYFLEVEYLWGDWAATCVNLFKNWYKIYIQREILFQRDSYDHCVKMRILLVFNVLWIYLCLL